MPKKVEMWEAEDGELFELEEEANEHEATTKLKALIKKLVTDSHDCMEVLDAILDESELAKAFSEYAQARKTANEKRSTSWTG